MELNPQQKQAVKLTQQHCLLLAGAGSGKTRVITEKIIGLLQKGVPAESIFAVTFTNKAAREMRNRLKTSIDSKLAGQLNISTFHTLGLKILREECNKPHSKLEYRANFTILDSSDAQQITGELLRQETHGFQGDEANALWAISALKNDLISPQAAIQQAEDAQDTATALLYARYQEQLKAYNAVDFDDLIYQTVQLLSKFQLVCEEWQQRIQYLLVDEYQDTNNCQYELIKILLGGKSVLTAVGDDDQSIYAWRGAKPENLVRLRDDFPSIELIKLEQNYRSMGRILQCANAVISNNPHDFDKKLWSALGHGDRLEIYPCENPEDEAERVVAEILHLKFQKGQQNDDFAILYRSNHQSRLIESALRVHSLPYQVSGGTSFFERSEIKDVLSYLRLLCNPNDDTAFLRVVNTPRREIGAKTLEKLANFSKQEDCSLLEAAQNPNARSVLGDSAYNRLSTFVSLIELFFDKTEDGRPDDLIQQLLKEIDYEGWLLMVTKEAKQAESRIENVQSLLEWVKQMRLRADDPEEFSLKKLVDKLSLLDILDKQEDDENKGIQLMTVHAAKGLEFTNVFVVGMEEGVLPHFNSTEDEQIQEERRLAYVAITRAQQRLYITYAKKRKRAGEWHDTDPSRFISELPEDDIDWHGKEDRSPEERKERGQSSIASLKAMLDN